MSPGLLRQNYPPAAMDAAVSVLRRDGLLTDFVDPYAGELRFVELEAAEVC